MLKDPDTGKVMRTGRTNNLRIRQGQHARAEATKGLTFEVDLRSDDYNVQRAREQYIHELYDHPPLNKLRPIQGPKMKNYAGIIATWDR